MKQLLFTFTLVFIVTSYAQVPNYVPTNGLVGWWGFNGNANDESGNGNNGTVNGPTLTNDRFGNPNSAYDFDGVNDYISCTNNFSQTFVGLSVSCWVKVSTYPASNYGKIVDFEEPSLGRPTIQTHFQNGFSYTAASGVGQVNNYGNQGQWVFVVGLWDGDNISLYINGNLTSFNFVNPSVNELIISNLSDLRFGARYNNVDYFHGSIDDIGIWNRALTECEILDLYNAQLNAPTVDLGGDQTLCTGNNVVLDAGAGYNYYSWSTGETTQAITVTETGEYTAMVGDSTPVANEHSLEFDGVDDYVGVSNVDINSNNFTWSTWVNVNPSTSDDYIIDNRVSTDVGGGFIYITSSFEAYYGYSEGGVPYWQANSGVILDPNTWYYITLVKSNDKLQIYLDGVFMDEIIVPSSINYNSTHFIGTRHNNNNGHFLDGRLDNFEIWNMALSSNQIQQFMNCPPTGSEPGLVGYWNFEEGSGITATDLTTNGNDGTINGATWSTDTPDQICLGCTASDTVNVSIIDPTITASDSVICIGDSVTLSVTNSTQALACSTLPSNLQNGLVAYYPFCGNANDESGNGNDGTVNGATLTSDRFGNPNSAYSFDGVDDYVLIDDSFDFPQRSVALFFQTNSFPSIPTTLLYNSHNNQLNYGITQLGVNSDSLAGAQIGYNSGLSNSLIPNEWYFASITTDGILSNFYLDGVLVQSFNYSSGTGGNAYNGTQIGCMSDFTRFFDGKIDDVCVWNRALSPSEIQELYELGNYDITWSTGDTTSSITVQPTQTTTYSVTVSDGISSCTDDVTVTVNDPQVNLGPDQDVCQGDSVLLDAGAGYDYYSWNTGDTTQSIYASQGGSYDATVGYQTPVSNNYSLEFDGDNKYISANDVTNQPTLLSVSAQVKLNSLTGHLDPQSFICEQGNNGVWRLAYDEPLQSYFFEVRIDNIHHTVYCGAELNEWVHLTGTYNRSSNTIKLFKNGVLQDELNNLPNLDLNSVSFPFTIGSRPNDPRSIIGRIDDVNIWNIELSQEQIQQYLNCPPTGNEPGLVGYWNFEEGSGTTATDLTSNGNDGTLVNGPIWSTDVPDQVCVSCTASDTVVINELLPTTSSITESNCDSYTAPDGQTYTSSGNYTAVIPNAVGCDSTITIDLTITNSNTGSETVTECDSYTWATNGQTYTQSGQYTSVLTNQSGCDSTVTLDLTITNSNSSFETITECDAYTWNADGQTYTQSGQYTTVLTNAAGCDSTVTLDLTINNADNGINQLDDITLEATASNAQYQWVDCSENYQAISGATGQTFEATVNGDYACIVTENGCSDTTACITISKVGISDLRNDGISVYPNPASSTLTIESQEALNTSYRMIDAQGREVLQGKLQGTSTVIDIENLAQGSYTLLFNQTELKIIKE